MNRKEMIEEISKQANCSKRRVRKRLFGLSAKMRRKYVDVLFNKAFLNKDTDWVDYDYAYAKWQADKKGNKFPWAMSNTFEVAAFPSGVNVMFRVDELYDGEIFEGLGSCGVRLYNFKGVHG